VAQVHDQAAWLIPWRSESERLSLISWDCLHHGVYAISQSRLRCCAAIRKWDK